MRLQVDRSIHRVSSNDGKTAAAYDVFASPCYTLTHASCLARAEVWYFFPLFPIVFFASLVEFPAHSQQHQPG